jgi:hypothetical protein
MVGLKRRRRERRFAALSSTRRDAGSQKISPARRGAVLSVLPDMPFDPEPYIPYGRCSLLERCPRSAEAAAIYFPRPPPAMMGRQKKQREKWRVIGGRLRAPAQEARTHSIAQLLGRLGRGRRGRLWLRYGSRRRLGCFLRGLTRLERAAISPGSAEIPWSRGSFASGCGAGCLATRRSRQLSKAQRRP